MTGQTGDKISGVEAGAGAVAHECTSSATAHVWLMDHIWAANANAAVECLVMTGRAWGTTTDTSHQTCHFQATVVTTTL